MATHLKSTKTEKITWHSNVAKCEASFISIVILTNQYIVEAQGVKTRIELEHVDVLSVPIKR